jgi:hypothetical protein
MENTSEYAGETMKDKLIETFEDAIENAVKAMISEVAENIVMMTVGTSVTASLSPILPELIAAKVTVGIIKTVTSFGGIL